MTKSASEIRYFLTRFLTYKTTQFNKIDYRNTDGRFIYVSP